MGMGGMSFGGGVREGRVRGVCVIDRRASCYGGLAVLRAGMYEGGRAGCVVFSRSPWFLSGAMVAGT